jgi:NADPH:quinone reductase-like Zn-dependent oxidoreductase
MGAMKAIVFDRHGDVDVLKYKDVPVPEISAHEVLIRIKATAMNHNDLWARKGLPGMDFAFPHISGSDASGIVEAVGKEVSRVHVGDEVVVNGALSCGRCPECLGGDPVLCPDFKIWGFQTGPLEGGQAEYGRVPEANVMRKPEHLTWEEASTLPLVLVTAWRMLVTRAQIKPGDFVLIWGGTGGLGCVAIQICKLFNAHPIVVVSSEEKVRFAQELGAEYAINRKKSRILREVTKITNRRGVDVVFEHVGTATWETSVHALKWGGTIVICGATSGFKVTTDLRFLWFKQQKHLGCHYGCSAEMDQAMTFVRQGLIKPVVAEVFPLQHISDGHRLMEAGELMGKIVLLP